MILGTLNTLKNFLTSGWIDGWMDGRMDDKRKDVLLQYNLKHLLFLTGPPCFFHLVTLFYKALRELETINEESRSRNDKSRVITLVKTEGHDGLISTRHVTAHLDSKLLSLSP